MSLKAWWQGQKKRRRVENASQETIRNTPLREFVYLDAVSLHSLLVSQNTTIPDNVSEGISRADEAELTGTAATDTLVAKAEIAGRYQTSNSNSVQSSRKAVIQTLFKEFRDLPLEFKLAARDEAPKPVLDVGAITTSDDPTVVEPAAAFTRGTLIEIEVTLAVDPVFKLGAMMTEYSAMADEYPAMFGAQGALGFLQDSQPVMKVLDRFLAGLIPIKATAIHHVVVEVGGQEFIVHKSAIEGLDHPSRPLHVVGVTEHLGYWKDIRRVLFSDGRFTLLCRIARDGIQEKWTPVKLADLFSDVAPDFVDQINAIKSPTAANGGLTSHQEQPQKALGDALVHYKRAIVSNAGVDWDVVGDDDFEALVNRLRGGPISAVAQRDAFDQVGALVRKQIGVNAPGAEEDLAARQSARDHAGLALFPASTGNPSSATAKSPIIPTENDDRMLDVEVIAIYW